MLNLTLLQNKIKRNAASYRPEFRQQMRSFDAQLSIYELSPPKESRAFGQLVMFLSHCAYLYPEDSTHFGESVLGLLEKNYETMDGELRKTLFQSLILLRNRGLVDPVTLITLCFSLFRCRDKGLREMLYSHILTDVRNVNRKTNDLKLNKAIQNVVFRMLEDPSSIAAKKSLQVMVDLYKRRVWVDSRTVNVIAQACLSKQPKNVAIALQFFLGIDEKIDALLEEEDEDQAAQSLEASTGKSREKLERGAQKTARQYSKSTRARARKQARDSKALRKARQASQSTSERRRASAPRFPAIDLLNDPQGFAEQLFKKLRASTDHFEVRLMMMNLVSRVIGYHKLLLLAFYSFLQKYLQPHQRHVTAILAYLIQASHDLVPAEDLEPTLKHIANNFVTDRSGPEVMAVGLNGIRELVAKVPLLTTGEGVDDLIQDLVQYKAFRRDKSVVMAARSLLNAMREINPAVLQRKERGKFHTTDQLPEYGQLQAAQGVDGAELLQYLEEEARRLAGPDDQSGEDEDEQESNEDASDGAKEDNGQEEDDEDEDDEEAEGEEEEEEEEEEDEGEDDEDDEEEADGEGEEAKGGSSTENGPTELPAGSKSPKSPKRKREEAGEGTQGSAGDADETLLEKAKRQKVNQTDRIDAKRLLSEEDFARIRKLKAKLEKEKRDPRARRKKDKLKEKQNQRNALLHMFEKKGFKGEGGEAGDQSDDDPFASDLSSSEDDSDQEGVVNDGSLNPAALEGVVRRRRRELADRLASVYEGRRGAHELMNKRGGGTNNLEKAKKKDFLMVSKSDRIRRKQVVSLRQQQQHLKKHIKNLEKSKKTVQRIRRRTNKSRA